MSVAYPRLCRRATSLPPCTNAAVERFHPVDDSANLGRLAAWLGDAALLRRVLLDNPARLYDFPA